MTGWLCLTYHRQRGHLETAPPFAVPCEGLEALFLHRTHRELNPGHRVTVHYTGASRCSEGFLLRRFVGLNSYPIRVLHACLLSILLFDKTKQKFALSLA